MTDPIRYSQPPVELPIDGWLEEGQPVNGCDVCEALARQRAEAQRQNNQKAVWSAAAEIRRHPHREVRK